MDRRESKLPKRWATQIRSPIMVELEERTDTTATGRSRAELPGALHVYAYIITMGAAMCVLILPGFFALLDVLSIMKRGGTNGLVEIFIMTAIPSVLCLIATCMEVAPELLNRPVGPTPRSARGLAGYLLKNTGKNTTVGTLDFSQEAPPGQLYLFSIIWSAIGVSCAFSYGWINVFASLPALVSLIFLFSTAIRRRRRPSPVQSAVKTRWP